MWSYFQVHVMHTLHTHIYAYICSCMHTHIWVMLTHVCHIYVWVPSTNLGGNSLGQSIFLTVTSAQAPMPCAPTTVESSLGPAAASSPEEHLWLSLHCTWSSPASFCASSLRHPASQGSLHVQPACQPGGRQNVSANTQRWGSHSSCQRFLGTAHSGCAPASAAKSVEKSAPYFPAT